jgi:hypothetical protein
LWRPLTVTAILNRGTTKRSRKVCRLLHRAEEG